MFKGTLSTKCALIKITFVQEVKLFILTDRFNKRKEGNYKQTEQIHRGNSYNGKVCRDSIILYHHYYIASQEKHLHN